ncbi:MAG: hypothetical protein IKN94_08465 [Salinivirgaceae bacterium]|nr:hypothetical protein [Salinivirgaceae bacterium]
MSKCFKTIFFFIIISSFVCCEKDSLEYELETNNTKSIYQNNYFTAHAFGRIDGYDYTNSKEAFYQSYANGYRIFEVDIQLTSDSIPVCMHDIKRFNKMSGVNDNDTSLTYDEFVKRKIFNKYTPVDVHFLIEMLLKYDSIYFDLDMAYDADIIMQYIVNQCDLANLSRQKQNEILNRLIIEIYRYEDYYKIQQIYPFVNCGLTLSLLSKNERDKHINFMLYNKLDLVFEEHKDLDSAIIARYNDLGINVVAWTVDDIIIAEQLAQYGCIGIQTNVLKP